MDDPSGRAEWRSPSGQLQLGHCTQCNEVHYYPRRVCPFCFSLAVDRVDASGRGRIYSHSFTPRGPHGPFLLAYVTLEEGVTMLTHLVDIDPAGVTIDDPVEVEFRTIGDVELPVFRPAR